VPWSSSDRKASLPPDWEQRRRACLSAANSRCQARIDDGQGWEWPTPMWIGPDDRCIQTATDVDHRSSRENHNDLQALCVAHHRQKTQRESAAGRAAVRKKLRLPTERPPGLL
jgi:5-methylcytosine-specific restriction protein A